MTFIPVIFDGMLDRNVPLPCFRLPRDAAPLAPGKAGSVPTHRRTGHNHERASSC